MNVTSSNSGMNALMSSIAGGDPDAVNLAMLKKAMDQTAEEATSLVSQMMPSQSGAGDAGGLGSQLDMRL